MDPKTLRDIAIERREKLGNKETRLTKALDGAADEIERLLKIALDALPHLQERCAGMAGGPKRSQLRGLIGKIIPLTPDVADDEQSTRDKT
jgi:hypothetical protein